MGVRIRETCEVGALDFTTHGNRVWFNHIRLSGDKKKDMSLTIQTDSHEVRIYGVTVHHLFKLIFTKSDLRLKIAIKGWMERIIEAEQKEQQTESEWA